MYQKSVNIKKSVFCVSDNCKIHLFSIVVLLSTTSAFQKWEKSQFCCRFLFSVLPIWPLNVKDCSIAFWIYDAVTGNLWAPKIMSLANTISQIFLQNHLNILVLGFAHFQCYTPIEQVFTLSTGTVLVCRPKLILKNKIIWPERCDTLVLEWLKS